MTRPTLALFEIRREIENALAEDDTEHIDALHLAFDEKLGSMCWVH